MSYTMGKNNLIISVIKDNLSNIIKLLEEIKELTYSYKHEDFTKHIVSAFVELKLALVYINRHT